jgi:hypothetical protein
MEIGNRPGRYESSHEDTLSVSFRSDELVSQETRATGESNLGEREMSDMILPGQVSEPFDLAGGQRRSFGAPELVRNDTMDALESFARDRSEIFLPGARKERKEKESKRVWMKLEQRYWDQFFEVQPTGELHVSELLCVILLFIPPVAKFLLPLSAVSRAWHERALRLPQWRFVQILRHPFVRPPTSIVELASKQRVASKGTARSELFRGIPQEPFVTTSTGKVFPAVASREVYLVGLHDRWKIAESERIYAERANRQNFTNRICWSLVTVFCGAIVLAIIFLVAWGIGMSPAKRLSTQGQVGAASFFITLILVLIAFVAALSIWHTRFYYGTLYRVRRNVEGGTVALSLGSLPIAFIGATVLTLLTFRIRALDDMMQVPVWDVNCSAASTLPFHASSGGQAPYFVRFPPRSAFGWRLNTTHPNPWRGFESNLTMMYLERAPGSAPCLGKDGLPYRVGILDFRAPWPNSSTTWRWIQDRNIRLGEELIFRTTRYHPYFPFPIDIGTGRSWIEGAAPVGWSTSQVALIGSIPQKVPDELPDAKRKTFNSARTRLLIACVILYVVISLTFCVSERLIECCLVSWGVVCLASLNSLNLIIIGAVCRYGDHPGFCLIDKSASQAILIFGIVLTILVIAFAGASRRI